VAAYKKALLASDSQISARTGAQPSANLAGSEDGEEQLQQLAKNKLDAIRNAQLKVTVGGEEIAVKDQVLKVVRTITAFKDFIGTAISAEPHAALAWAGVAVILPVSTALRTVPFCMLISVSQLLSNPVTQVDDAIDGLEYISGLLVRCRVMETSYKISSTGSDHR